MKVCYITSRSALDTRISKEILSLKRNNYAVAIVSSSDKIVNYNDVQIVSIKSASKGFFYRNFILPYKLYKAALKVEADIYHFHEPGMLAYVKRLKKNKRKVIFDAFEDHPTLLFEKNGLPTFALKLLSKLYSCYENYKCKYVDGILCCYHWTYDRLKMSCGNIQLVFNFPILEEPLTPHNFDFIDECTLCYTGLISPIWNIDNLIKALPKSKSTLLLAGNATDKYLHYLMNEEGWKNVVYHGMLLKNELKDKIFNKSKIGVALLGYISLCKGKIGNMSNNKMFEYMKEGLPLICTNFTLWKEVVEENKCGICVNPYDIDQIVDAINYLRNHPTEAKRMGLNGQKAILEKYNWSTQEKNLLAVYNSIV